MLGMKKGMSNKEVADLLEMVAAAFEIKDGDFFRVRAYKNAAASIEHLSSQLKDVWDADKLEEIPGVGPSLAQHLDELIRTGRVKHFEQEVKGLPLGMFELMKLEGVGAKTAYKLASEFDLKDEKTAIDRLRRQILAGKIKKLQGFGEKTEDELLKAIGSVQSGSDRLLLPEAEAIAEEVVEYLRSSGLCEKIEVLGSLRRRAATVGDIDLAVMTDKPTELMEYLLKFKGIKKVLSTGSKTTMFIHSSGRQVDVKTQSKDRWGSMLQHYTGSKLHNIHLRKLALEKKMSLSEHGIKKGGKLYKYAGENEFYEALGLKYIPPELREDSGEIEASIKGRLPDLVELKDIKGDLHMHTNIEIETSHDMGASSVSELLNMAESLGYEYIGLSDHNPKMKGLSEVARIKVVKKRNEAIDKEIASSESSVKIFKGMEVDIRPDGRLAVSDEVLGLLDYAVVSIHASFRQSKEEATERVLRAFDHPRVKIFGHPTGRMLNKREGLDYDWERVFEECRRKRIAVEINSSPERLDLPDMLVRQAVKTGVLLVINTDAHEASSMKGMRYGVGVARRGWAEASNIINTWPYKRVEKWIES